MEAGGKRDSWEDKSKPPKDRSRVAKLTTCHDIIFTPRLSCSRCHHLQLILSSDTPATRSSHFGI